MKQLPRLPERPAWMSSGLCSQTDPDLFYPDEKDVHTARRAKAVCEDCPVRWVCAEYAIDHRMNHGIWGGLTPDQRRKARREMRSAA